MAYYKEDEEGTRRLPRKDEEGTYHIEGKLVMAAPRQVVGLVKNCREVLEEVPDNMKVLVGPGPRYLQARCCDKPGRCTNFGEAGYRKDLLSDMQEAKEGDWGYVQGHGPEELQVDKSRRPDGIAILHGGGGRGQAAWRQPRSLLS